MEKKAFTMVILSVVLFGFPTSWAGTGPDVSQGGLTATLDQESAKVGSVVQLTLNYDLPAGARLPEEVEIAGIEDLTVLEIVSEPGRIRLKLMVDRLGTWKTGPLRLSYLMGEAGTGELEAEPVSILVMSNLGETPAEAELLPIEEIIPTRSLWRFFPWVVGTAALLLAGMAGYILYRKRRARRLFSGVEAIPHVVARMELEQLEAQGLFEKGEWKRFYFLFSEILRRYLEAIRNFPAAEFTTEEISQHFHETKNEQDRGLLPLLRQADLVKFADTVPTPARKEEDMKRAVSYIRETQPAQQEAVSR